jgi:hypothetical protein
MSDKENMKLALAFRIPPASQLYIVTDMSEKFGNNDSYIVYATPLIILKENLKIKVFDNKDQAKKALTNAMGAVRVKDLTPLCVKFDPDKLLDEEYMGMLFTAIEAL